MAKNLTLKSLEKDKEQLEAMMKRLQQQIAQSQVQLYRWDGALGFIVDNIKRIKGEGK